MPDDLWIVEDELVAERPRFCPRCDREAAVTESLCEHCGDTLLLEGYCPVCESFARGAPGDLCRKHELPLEDRIPSAPALVKDATMDWVTVASYVDGLQASAPQLRLEAKGIPTFLDGEYMGVNTIYQVATGGVKLQVPRENLEDARILLSQVWTPLHTIDDAEEEWEETAPGPWDTRRSVMKGVILLYLAPLALGIVTALAAFVLYLANQLLGRG